MNDRAGARTPLALVFASITLALCLLFLTGLLENLPKAVLAAVVLTAVWGLLDFPALLHMWRVSRIDFYAAAIALGAVLLLGILQGILLAALASVSMLLVRTSRPHVAFLGRVPGTDVYSDLARHPENEALPGAIAFRPEGSLIYVNADAVWKLHWVDLLRPARPPSGWWSAIFPSPHLDLAGSRMLHALRRRRPRDRCLGPRTGPRSAARRRPGRQGRRARPAGDPRPRSRRPRRSALPASLQRPP